MSNHQTLSHNSSFLKLNEELTRSIPNFKNISKAIEEISPAILSIAITEDVGFTYLIDYYFRHIDIQIVKTILQNPMFTNEALTELFYCQVTSYHKAILQKKPFPDLFSSYWSSLSKAEYAILFKNLLKTKTHIEILKSILEKVDLIYIRMMTKSGTLKSKSILTFFKNLGSDLQKFAAKDMNIYDFAVDLAVANSDDDFLTFLDDYTIVFVQLRLVASFVEEVEAEIKKNNGQNLNNMQIMNVCKSIPRDCLEITLDIFKDKNWISENEKKSIKEYYS